MATVRIVRPAFSNENVLGAANEGGSPLAVGNTAVITLSARSEASETPSPWIVGLAYASVILFAVGALLSESKLHAPMALAIGMNAFALFYLAAQGIERALEPLSHYLLSTEDTKEKLAAAKDKAATENIDSALLKAKEAADEKANLKRQTRERAIVFWAIATDAGILVSALLGLNFFAAVLAPSDPPGVPQWIDVIATGLVIGGGTKALHDLISRMKKPDAEAEGTASET